MQTGIAQDMTVLGLIQKCESLPKITLNGDDHLESSRAELSSEQRDSTYVHERRAGLSNYGKGAWGGVGTHAKYRYGRQEESRVVGNTPVHLGKYSHSVRAHTHMLLNHHFTLQAVLYTYTQPVCTHKTQGNVPAQTIVQGMVNKFSTPTRLPSG